MPARSLAMRGHDASGGCLAGGRAARWSAAPNTSATHRGLAATSAASSVPRGASSARGAAPSPPLIDPDAHPAVAVRPEEPGRLRRLLLAPGARLRHSVARGTVCLLPNEQEFRREVFRRDTADRPEAVVQGRVTDDAGKRIEAAKLRVWFQGTAILDETSAKDGSLSPAAAGRALDATRCGSATRATPPRSPSCGSIAPGRPCATSASRPSRRSADASPARHGRADRGRRPCTRCAARTSRSTPAKPPDRRRRHAS